MEKSKKKKDQDQEGTWVRYRTPSWLANQVWEVFNFKARNTWTCNLRVYNVIPRDSLVFEFVRTDNIEGIKTLFSRKMASPFDRDDVHGWTTLHFATSRGNLSMCKFLLEEGADANLPDFTSRTPLHELSSEAGHLAFEEGVRVTELFRLLLSRDVDILAEDKEKSTALSDFRGPKDAFALLLQQASPTGFEQTLTYRTRAAIQISKYSWHNTTQLVRMALGRGPIDPAALDIVGEEGMMIMDGVLRSLAFDIFYCFGYESTGDEICDVGYNRPSPVTDVRNSTWANLCHGWSALLKELLQAGAELHHINSSGKTPFLMPFTAPRYIQHSTTHDFQTWIQHLCDAGVDLVQYGQRESYLHATGHFEKEFLGRRLIGFSYGPRASDWYLWWSEPTDVYAGDFWRIIDTEYRERAIPGAWVE